MHKETLLSLKILKKEKLEPLKFPQNQVKIIISFLKFNRIRLKMKLIKIIYGMISKKMAIIIKWMISCIMKLKKI